MNKDQRDNLCLSDVYFDVSSSSGSTDMLKCRFNGKVCSTLTGLICMLFIIL